jgi:hypothetical protein
LASYFLILDCYDMENIDSHRIEIVAILFCICLLLLLVRLIMHRKLQEEYILVWIGVLIALAFFAIFRGQLDRIATLIGVHYAPSFLFLIIIAAMLVYSLHLSVVVSSQGNQIKELAQKIAILEEKLS